MGYEEVDYSEEAKYDLFESARKKSLEWAQCVMSRLPAPLEKVNEEMEKLGMSITKKEYEKICREMGLSGSAT